MKRLINVSLAAATFSVVACFLASTGSRSPRTEILAQAFRTMAKDPLRAADLFAEAGSGPSLEEARMHSWLSCLEAGAPDADRWQSYLEADPPPTLRTNASLHLARRLAKSGKSAEAISWLKTIDGNEVDLARIEIGEPAIKEEAARRLAVEAPAVLRRHSPSLDDTIRAGLDPEQALARAENWLARGSSARASSELRGLRFQGDAEKRRRRILASAAIEMGRISSALRVLPSARRGSFEDTLLRAAAYRRRGWQRFPRPSATQAFTTCADLAGGVVSSKAPQEIFDRANEVLLECATESGDLDTAVAAWRQVNPARPPDRIDWLGRRLGLALVRRGRDAEWREISRRLPAQARCLQYWAAERDSSQPDLERLGRTPVADLYATWARALTGATADPCHRRSSIHPAPLPPTVGWLVDCGARDEALHEWRRIRSRRTIGPREALAAAQFEASLGRHNNAIRILRIGFPELADIEAFATIPIDAAREYLPLRWADDLHAAARESGVDPWLLAGLARQESVFTAHARSHRGAIGVLQLIPGTAALHGRRLGLGSRLDLTDPSTNLRLGAQELARLIAEFDAIEPALAAYNAGPSRVRTWWRRNPDPSEFSETVPIPETYTYIRRVVFLAEAYRVVYAEQWRKK